MVVLLPQAQMATMAAAKPKRGRPRKPKVKSTSADPGADSALEYADSSDDEAVIQTRAVEHVE